MGVQGLWTVVEECKAAAERWDARVVGERDLIVVDWSAVEYAVLALGGASAADHAGAGRYRAHAAALRAWLRAWLQRGFRVLVVLDGGVNPAHAATFVRRRQQSAAPWDEGKLSSRELALAFADDSAAERPQLSKGPLSDAMAAGVLARERALWGADRLAELTATRDADGLIAAVCGLQRARVAAVVTADSDLLVHGVERVLRMERTVGLFDEDGAPADVLLSFTLHGASGAATAVLHFAREQLRSQRRPDLGFQAPGLNGEAALVSAVPWCAMADVAACLGNDVSHAVRDAAAARGFGPWRIIRHLLSKRARGLGWVSEGRATQKLFVDLKLPSIARKRWREYCAARAEYAAPPHPRTLVRAPEGLLRMPGARAEPARALWPAAATAPPPAVGGAADPAGAERVGEAAACAVRLDGSSAARQRARDASGWLPPQLLEWRTTGLAAFSRFGVDSRVHQGLRPARALAAAVLAGAGPAQLPPGWVLTELAPSARTAVALALVPPAHVRPTHTVAAVHPGCFVPPLPIKPCEPPPPPPPPPLGSQPGLAPPGLAEAPPWGPHARALLARARLGMGDADPHAAAGAHATGAAASEGSAEEQDRLDADSSEGGAAPGVGGGGGGGSSRSSAQESGAEDDAAAAGAAIADSVETDTQASHGSLRLAASDADVADSWEALADDEGELSRALEAVTAPTSAAGAPPALPSCAEDVLAAAGLLLLPAPGARASSPLRAETAEAEAAARILELSRAVLAALRARPACADAPATSLFIIAAHVLLVASLAGELVRAHALEAVVGAVEDAVSAETPRLRASHNGHAWCVYAYLGNRLVQWQEPPMERRAREKAQRRATAQRRREASAALALVQPVAADGREARLMPAMAAASGGSNIDDLVTGGGISSPWQAAQWPC